MAKPTNTTPQLDQHAAQHAATVDAVADFGAVPNTGTDSSAAIRAAHAAAPGAHVYYPKGQYLYNSSTPLTLGTNESMIGSGNTTTQIYFTGSGGIKLGPGHNQSIRDMFLWTNNADLITAGDTVTPVSGVNCYNVMFVSTSTTAHLLYGPSNTALIGARFWGCTWDAATNYTAAPIYLIGGSHNTNFWYASSFQDNGSTTATKYFVHIESTSAVASLYQNVFRDVVVEGGVNGVFKFLGTVGSIVDGCVLYDAPASIASDIVVFADAPAGAPSAGNKSVGPISTVGLAGGIFGVNADTSESDTIETTALPVKVGSYTKLYNVAGPSTVTGTPYSAIYMNGPIEANNGLRLKRKAGAPVDGDFDLPVDGIMAVDTTNSKLYVRIGGTWKGVTVT